MLRTLFPSGLAAKAEPLQPQVHSSRLGICYYAKSAAELAHADTISHPSAPGTAHWRRFEAGAREEDLEICGFIRSAGSWEANNVRAHAAATACDAMKRSYR